MNNMILSYLRARAKFATDPLATEILDSVADDIEDMTQEDTAKVQECMEPYLLGGVVTRKVLRCGNCNTEVKAHDRYCRVCGRRLME